MADETNPTPAPAGDITINPDPQQTITINSDPVYDPANDKRPAFQKVQLNPKGPTIEAAPDPTTLQRLTRTVLNALPNYSDRTVDNPKYGKAVPDVAADAMSSGERQRHPKLAGALEAAGEMVTPENVLGVAATAGASEAIPAASVIPKLVSALFAGGIAASVYNQYPELKAASDKAAQAKTPEERASATQEATRVFTHMGIDTAVGLMAAHHGVEGARDIISKAGSSGLPDEASTFKNPGSNQQPEELTHMNRETVQNLRDLGYSNQQITNFNISDIHRIVTGKIPATATPASPLTAPLSEPTAVGEALGKLGGHLVETARTGIESAKEELTSAANAKAPEGSLEAGFAKLGGKKVGEPTSKSEPDIQQAHEDYLDRHDQVTADTIREYDENVDNKGYRQQWSVVPAGRLTKIWNDYAKLGFVRDEKGINQIADTVLDNIHKIQVNNVLTGHSQESAGDLAEQVLGDRDGHELDHFDKHDTFFNDEKGNWRLTDYAAEPLNRGALDIMLAKTPEQKLQAVDRVLNIIHQRSDLPGWFVEGGTKTLNSLAGRPSDVEPKPSPATGTLSEADRNNPAYAQTLAKRGQLPNQTVNLGDLGTYVGGLTEPTAPAATEAPAPPTKTPFEGVHFSPVERDTASYHPDLQKVADQNGGTHTDPEKVVEGDAAHFITPDGKFISLDRTHDDAIEAANPDERSANIRDPFTNKKADNRIGFMDDTGAIRTRFRIGRSGKTLSVTVPRDGIRSDQVTALQQVVGKMGREGNLVMERSDVQDAPDELSTKKEFVRPSDVEPMLREIGAHPEQKVEPKPRGGSVSPTVEPEKTPEVAPSKKLQASANRYAKSLDMPRIDHSPVPVDVERAKEIAKIYDEAKHDPNDPRVKAAYDALKSETKAQFNHLRKDIGLKFEPQAQDPYSSAGEMMNDIKKNNRLKVFTGSSTGPDHPLSEIDPETGESYNTIFRWVHDAMGHAAGGHDFSEGGEKSATESHAQMYSDTARPAMRNETEGQTSWFFHNPEVEAGRAEPGDFAEQKASLLPDVSHDWHTNAGKMAAKNEAGGINPRTGNSDSKGTATELMPEYRQPIDHVPTAEDFKNYYEQHKDIFDKYPELRVGWDNNSAVPGGHEINIGAVGEGAARVAKKLDQKSAFDIAKGEIIPTKGSGLRTDFPNYPIEERIKDLKGENQSNIPGFEHLTKDIYDHLEPDERDYLKGDKTIQRNVMSQYHKIQPSVAETTNAMQAGAALGGWWKRYIDVFHGLLDEPKGLNLYHGSTTKGIKNLELRPGKNSTIFGNEPVERSGIFLTPDKKVAAEYAGKNGEVTSHTATFNNLADFTNPSADYQNKLTDELVAQGINRHWLETAPVKDWERFDGDDGKMFVSALKKAGYDGAKILDENGSGKTFPSFIAFSPDTVKPTAEQIANTIGPSHAEILKQWHAAVSGNKSVQDANNLAWHSYADWLDAGKPTDRKSIDDIIKKNAAQPEDAGKKGNAAISDTLDRKGKIKAEGLDTSKIFNLVNSPEMRGERPFSGDVFRDDEPFDTKVVDKSGKPLTVYHGSTASEPIKKFQGASFPAWFAESPGKAAVYAKTPFGDTSNAHIYPVNLAINNPLDLTKIDMDSPVEKNIAKLSKISGLTEDEIEQMIPGEGSSVWEIVHTPDFAAHVKQQGYDGVKANESGHTTWAPVSNNQIKSIFDPKVGKNPLMGKGEGYRKIPSMGATVAGKGNLNRLVIDTHIADFYGRELKAPAARYIADSAHLRQAAEALGLKGGEGQEQLWGTVLGLKTLLKEGLTPAEAGSKLNADVINKIGKDYAEIIANDPEITRPGGLLDRLKDKYGIGRGSAGVSSTNLKTPSAGTGGGEQGSGQAATDTTLLSKTAGRIRGQISDSKIKNPTGNPSDIGDTVSKFAGSNESFYILDKTKAKGSTWTSGGCWILADAVQKEYGGDLVAITSPDGQVQHIGTKIGNRIIDADGSKSPEDWRSFWEKTEGVKGAKISPLDPKKVSSEIPAPERQEEIRSALKPKGGDEGDTSFSFGANEKPPQPTKPKGAGKGKVNAMDLIKALGGMKTPGKK